jgi:hypothetical protein
MEYRSMQKLMNAGYTIIRKDDHPCPRIKYRKKDSGDWKTLEKFATKAARDRKHDELLNEEFIIES